MITINKRLGRWIDDVVGIWAELFNEYNELDLSTLEIIKFTYQLSINLMKSVKS